MSLLTKIIKALGGPVPGVFPVNKWGENFDIDAADAAEATPQKIWPIKRTTQDYIFLDSAVEAKLLSTSANDTAAGDGARTVIVFYQNAAGVEVSELIELDGIAGVDLSELTVGSFRMKVETTGDDNRNVGAINLVRSSDNAILAHIAPGEGQTQIAVYRIPNNYSKAKIKEHTTAYGRTGVNNEANMRLRVRKADGTIVTKWDPAITTLNPKDEKKYNIGGVSVNPGEWVFWECIGVSANDTPVRATFDIEMEK